MKYKRIRELREDKDLTQKQVADKLYMHLTQYRRYESGERAIPLETAISIAKMYNASHDYLAESTDIKKSDCIFKLTENENHLISKFRNLNEINQGRLLERLDYLISESNN